MVRPARVAMLKHRRHHHSRCAKKSLLVAWLVEGLRQVRSACLLRIDAWAKEVRGGAGQKAMRQKRGRLSMGGGGLIGHAMF